VIPILAEDYSPFRYCKVPLSTGMPQDIHTIDRRATEQYTGPYFLIAANAAESPRGVCLSRTKLAATDGVYVPVERWLISDGCCLSVSRRVAQIPE
jgi:hypothetical protein